MAAVAESPDDDCTIPLLSPISPRDQNVVVCPTSRHPATTSKIIVLTILCLSLLIVPLATYIFWPSDPTLTIVRLRLTKVKIHTVPFPSVDVTMRVTVEVRNVDVYSVELRRLDVEVSYRGKRLGEVTLTTAGVVVVRGFATSYLEAEMEVNGVGVLSDAVLLIRDVKKGKVPFGTVAEVGGKFGFLSFGFPFTAKMWCEVLLNTHNQTIVRRSCY